jgi:hypothetical protein
MTRRMFVTGHPPAAALAAILALGGCAYHAERQRPVAPSTGRLVELWDGSVDVTRRDLFHGPGGRRLAPSNKVSFTFVAKDTAGASPKIEVREPGGRKWDVKFGPEASAEVAASRLVWALGYHQPPTYYLPSWTLTGGPKSGVQQGARFRPQIDELKSIGSWAWHENPFVGTRQLNGLFVLMVMINNWDLKTSQNVLYESRARSGPRVRYVVRDVGASFGATRWFFPGSKSDIEDFEREPFIAGVSSKGIVDFHYRGAWRQPHLDDDITPADVRWVCQRLSRLRDAQWRDAFRAGGYPDAVASRFTARMKAKVREGLRLGQR